MKTTRREATTPPNMRDAALGYASEFLPVFPCQPGLKTPLTKRGVHDATTNSQTIRELFDRCPDANIALHAGAAGYLVVDVDPGADVAALERQYKLPPTKLRARTPRGGEHRYYTLPRGVEVPPSASKIARHVDIRNRGESRRSVDP